MENQGRTRMRIMRRHNGWMLRSCYQNQFFLEDYTGIQALVINRLGD